MIKPMTATPISVLIIERYPLMRVALQTALEEEPDLCVVGQGADGEQGFDMFIELQPDVVLLDLLLPGRDGLGLISKILARDPSARIMLIANQESPQDIQAAMQAGVLGYFPKMAARNSLLEAVRTVAAGRSYFPIELPVRQHQSTYTTHGSG